MTANTSAAREAVAGEVRAVIARRRASQVKIARALGMSQSALSRRLLGDLPFEVDALFAVAKYLDVPVGDFFPHGAAETSCMNSTAMTFTAA